MTAKIQIKRFGVYGSLAITRFCRTLLAVRARAAGIPDAAALTYTGYLEIRTARPSPVPKALASRCTTRRPKARKSAAWTRPT